MTDAVHVFTYGSLMFPVVWQAVVCGTYRSQTASVHGFRRVCVRDAHHPALIVSSRAAPMVGRLYFDVAADDLSRLDHFETASYQRVSVAVTVEVSPVVAQAYLAVNNDLLTEFEWSEHTFEQIGLPLFLASYAIKNRPPD